MLWARHVLLLTLFPSYCTDEECHWENVRVLKDGETVSVDGTHLGKNV
jgi:hypothetical protein